MEWGAAHFLLLHELIVLPLYICVLLFVLLLCNQLVVHIFNFINMHPHAQPGVISQTVYDLCRSPQSLSTEYAKNPKEAPGEILKRLYRRRDSGWGNNKKVPNPSAEHDGKSSHEMKLIRALECGNWGESKPSNLFLSIYHDVLCTLEEDSMAGMTSPSLLGSSGIIPLTIIAPLPDVCRHMSNCIVRAQKEVFLATNYWVASDASTFITDSLMELSRRAGERGDRVVVKILYDRGSLKQVIESHQFVSEKEYTGERIKLPARQDIPNIDLEVVNFHTPVLGTFHSKYMIVDRRLALLNSNNIQDNDNLEMMTHLEGPIVDSFYDMCLASWHNSFRGPPLPCHNSPAASAGMPILEQKSFSELFDTDGCLKVQLRDGGQGRAETIQNDDLQAGETLLNAEAVQSPGQMTREKGGEEGQAVFLSEHTTNDAHYDDDIAGEIIRMQMCMRPRVGETRMQATTRHLNTTIQPKTTGDAPECDIENGMMPYIPHKAHKPFPVAMVCRKPFGAINHSSLYNPQNAAFLSAISHANESIFIQTPDLNAAPLIPAILGAIRRGVTVTCFLTLGYNDAGELLPCQGGTNDMVANKLYTSLSTDEEKARLRIFNYVAKDQIRPIHNKFKKRSSHVKLMIVDESIAIQGNGNQDTQSWFHSQEVNVLIDNPDIARKWKEGILRNQNTHIYGKVSEQDGCWRDETGKLAEGCLGTDPGRFSWLTGVYGAVQRVRGMGGF